MLQIGVQRSRSSQGVRVYLTRPARATLAKLDPFRREALTLGFGRVGRELFASAQQVNVPPGWAKRTWPRRRYPQQCYPKTLKYILDHPNIPGIRLVHGVVSHAPHFLPLDHAWVELPGQVVFDGVVQTFFTQPSYYSVMSAMVVQKYSASAALRLVGVHGHGGPWNAKWVPTVVQLKAYAAAVRAL